MKFKTTITILGLVIIFLSCRKEEKSVLFGCCGMPAIDASFGNGHIYIPNIFTPDGDGINDKMWILGDSIGYIIHMEIRSKDGMLVYEAGNFLHNDPYFAWDGELNGIVQKGLYSIVLTVRARNGTVAVFEGSICNYPCNDLDITDFISVTNCQFGDQVDADYRFDPNIPTAENFQVCFN